MFKNVGRDLQSANLSDIYEIKRLLKGNFKPSELTAGDLGNSSIGATTKTTMDRWAGGTPTKDW